MPRSEDYPGQSYFHEHNANIRKAEENFFRSVPTLRYLDIRDRPSSYYLYTGRMVTIKQWVTKEELEQMFGESNGS